MKSGLAPRLRLRLHGYRKTIPLDGPPLVIGRDKRANVAIPRKSLEYRNTLAAPIGDVWMMFDLRTPRQIVCDGRKVASCVLRPGTTVRLGDLTAVVEAEEGHGAAHAEDVRSKETRTFGDTPAGSARMRIWREGGGEPWNFEGEVRENVLLGRSPECDLRLPEDAGVSNRHAFLAWNEGDSWLFELCTNTGLKVDGRTTRAIRLRDVGVVGLGDLRLRLEHSAGARERRGSDSGSRPPSSSASNEASSSSSGRSQRTASSEAFVQDPSAASPAELAFQEARKELGDGRTAAGLKLLYRACELAPLEVQYRKRLREAQRDRFGGQRERVSLWARILDPSRALAVRAARRLRRYDQALKLVERSLERNPWSVRLARELALLFAELERARNLAPVATLWGLMCVREFGESLIVDPSLNATIGEILIELGEYDAVGRVLLKAIELHRDDERLRKVVQRAKVLRTMSQN